MGCASSAHRGGAGVTAAPASPGVAASVYKVASPNTAAGGNAALPVVVGKARSTSSTSDDGTQGQEGGPQPHWAPSDVSSASMAQDDESALPPLRLRNSRERGGMSKGKLAGSHHHGGASSSRKQRQHRIVGGSGAPAFLSRSGTHSPTGGSKPAPALTGATVSPPTAVRVASSRSVNRNSGSVMPRMRGGKVSPPLARAASVDRAPLRTPPRTVARVYSLDEAVTGGAADAGGGTRHAVARVGAGGGSGKRVSGSARGAGVRTVSGPVTLGGSAPQLSGGHVTGLGPRREPVSVAISEEDSVPSPLSSCRSAESGNHFTSSRSLRFDGANDDGDEVGGGGGGGGVAAATRGGLMSQFDERDARMRMTRPPLRVLVETRDGSSGSMGSGSGSVSGRGGAGAGVGRSAPSLLGRLLSSCSGGSSDDELITSGIPGLHSVGVGAGASDGGSGSGSGGGSGLAGVRRPPPLGLSVATVTRGMSALGSDLRPAGLYIDAAASSVSDGGRGASTSPREFTEPTLVTPNNDEDVPSALQQQQRQQQRGTGSGSAKRVSPTDQAPHSSPGASGSAGTGLGGASRFGGGFAGLRVHSGNVPSVNTTFSDDEDDGRPPQLGIDTGVVGGGVGGGVASGAPGVTVPQLHRPPSTPGRRSASEGNRPTVHPNGIAAHAGRRGSGSTRTLHARSPSPGHGLRSVGGMGLALNCGVSTSAGRGRPPGLRVSASLPVPAPFLGGDLFQMPLGVSPRLHSRSPNLGASPRMLGAALFKSQSLGTRRAPTVVRVPTPARELTAAATNYRRLHGEFDAIALLPPAGEVSPSFRMSTQNRHSMFPFTHSVVRLTSDRYINASHIQFPAWPRRRYIAAMGPLPKTVGPFWTSVWEQDVSVVAMLTKEKEGRRNKCYRYWPELGAAPLAPPDAGVTVTAVHSVELGVRQCGGSGAAVAAAAAFDASLAACGADVWKDHDDTSPADAGSVAWATSGMNTPSARPVDVPPEKAGVGIIARHFVMRHVSDDAAPGPARVVTQLQCVSWPDGAVPSSTANTMALRRLAVSRHALPAPASAPGDAQSRPLMAHCSAGVGRTGTFIVADRLLCELEAVAAASGRGAVLDTEVDIAAEVCAMRQCRTCMCYTPEQYAFVYRMVADAVRNIATHGVTEGTSAPPAAAVLDAALGGSRDAEAGADAAAAEALSGAGAAGGGGDGGGAKLPSAGPPARDSASAGGGGGGGCAQGEGGSPQQ